jgi:hypothetical protein
MLTIFRFPFLSSSFMCMFDDDEDKGAELTKQGMAISAEERKKRDAKIGTTDPYLDSFLGPDIEHTPFYKTLNRLGTEATSRKFDDARTADRKRGQMAGFGYEQPASQASQTAIDVDEAEAMSRVPGEAMLQATDPGFKAASLKTSQAGLFSPVPYFSAATNVQTSKDSRDANEQMMLMQALAQAGGNAWDKYDDEWGNIFG